MDQKFKCYLEIPTNHSKTIQMAVEIDDGYDEDVITKYNSQKNFLGIELETTNFRSLNKSLQSLLERTKLSYDTINFAQNESKYKNNN
ncbi:hypothetical protein CWI39_1264p0010 [Hamiltosporidium magnivora]|uniref:Uncharacterized protein n=1 Tax=Hamiltosporidium magnivora TaxID=148818 RepID=A0A4Q9L5T7_9MICR|nr:hypothetical protein CWI39_1264p0010 [Hamiltosporidium magnivora]